MTFFSLIIMTSDKVVRSVLRMCAVALLAVLTLAGSGVRADDAPAAEAAWDRSLAIGLNLSEGNTDTTLAHASLRMVREHNEDYVRLLMEGTYGETDEDTTTQKARGQIQYRRHLDGSFVYIDLDSQHDDPAGVDYRVIVGPGLGRYLMRAEGARLSAEIGLGYLWEEVADAGDEHVVLRIAERGNWDVSETARFWESVELIPKAENLGNYLLISELGIESAITSQIYLRLVLQDRYDSEPAMDIEHNDLSIISALTWRL